VTSYKFCFDIDGVLVTPVKDLDYLRGKPIQKNIDAVNKLYMAGHRITLFTARGSETGIDWLQRTIAQMREFGVLFHKCLVGKPAADFYVDDKLLDIETVREMADACDDRS
jgi:hypothetical protein